MKIKKILNKKILLLSTGVISVFFVIIFTIPALKKISYQSNSTDNVVISDTSTQTNNTANTLDALTNTPFPANVTHVPAPEKIKAIYMTKWIASSKKSRDKLISIIDNTEINAIVIDVKDYTGKLSYKPGDPNIAIEGSGENTIKDLGDLVSELHSKNIYVIARVAVFQDAYFAQKHPEFALKSKTTGELWQDRAHIHWLDAGAEDVWKYVVAIGKDSYKFGFDEINFDYIRYPSDGNLKDIQYPKSEGLLKSDVITNFYKYLHDNLSPEGIKISGDIFGLVTTETTDMGIGQLLIPASTYFDYIDPMVYPSHFAPGTYGYKNPSLHPYEIVNYSMKKAVERLTLAQIDPKKIRPWLQDFDLLGVKYTAEMVRNQIKAVEENNLPNWMLWSAANVYTVSALEKN